jgi:hypothetical protein
MKKQSLYILSLVVVTLSFIGSEAQACHLFKRRAAACAPQQRACYQRPVYTTACPQTYAQPYAVQGYYAAPQATPQATQVAPAAVQKVTPAAATQVAPAPAQVPAPPVGPAPEALPPVAPPVGPAPEAPEAPPTMVTPSAPVPPSGW